jgi:hypothetical protein
MNDEMDNRIDFSTLDPTANADRFARVVDSILEASGPELAARRGRLGVIAEVGRWRRPMLVAAALAAMLSIVVLNRLPTTAAAEPTAESAGIVEALGVPTALADLMRAGELPAASAVLYGMELQ